MGGRGGTAKNEFHGGRVQKTIWRHGLGVEGGGGKKKKKKCKKGGAALGKRAARMGRGGWGTRFFFWFGLFGLKSTGEGLFFFGGTPGILPPLVGGTFDVRAWALCDQ